MKPSFGALFGATLVLGLAIAHPAALAQQPRSGGSIITLNNIEPTHVVTPIGTGGSGQEISAKLHDTLIHENRGKFEPRLATSWVVSPDGKSYRFNLRRDVKWHDGKPFTSADVAFTAEEVWKKYSGTLGFERIVKAETPDAHTVVLRLDDPVSTDFLLASFGTHIGQVLPRHKYAGTNFQQNPNNRAPVGTGPFKFKEWVPGQYLTLERNPDYFRKPFPYLDRVTFKFERNAATAAAAIEAGEATLVTRNSVPLRDLARLDKLADVAVTEKGSENAAWFQNLELNVRNPITGNVKVRQAIAQSINAKQLSEVVFLGRAKPAAGPIHAGTHYADPAARPHAFDTKRAEELLDEAGYKRGDGGVRFTLNFVVAQWFPVNLAAGEVIKQNLEAVGIRANLITLDYPGTLRRIYRDYDFDIALSNSVRSVDPGIVSFTPYWSKGILPGIPFRNSSGYSSPEMEAAIEAGFSERDAAKRLKAIHDFQRIALRDVPIIHLVEMQQVNVYREELQNVSANDRWYFTNWEDLWLRK